MSDRKWYVLVFDDDKTPMEFVVYLLGKVFQKGANDAEHTMLDTHHNGIAICAAYDRREDAVAKIGEASSLAREHRHPLQVRCAFGDAGLGAATLVFHLVPSDWTSDMPPGASRTKASIFNWLMRIDDLVWKAFWQGA